MNRSIRTFASAALVALTTAAAACSDSPTIVGSGTPAAVSTTGNNQTGQPNTTLTSYLVVQVKDDAGRPLSGVSVTWEVGTGGGTLTSAQTTTDAFGRAAAAWTLGATDGTQTVTASVSGIAAPVVFTATADDGGTIPF